MKAVFSECVVPNIHNDAGSLASQHKLNYFIAIFHPQNG